MNEFGFGGNTPQEYQSGETLGSKRLFFSRPEIALIKGKQVCPGYGILRAGQLMAETTVRKDLVPYVPSTTPQHKQSWAGNAFLLQDQVNGQATCAVSIADSYKFTVADEIVLVNDNSGTPVLLDGGAISAIDRTTYPQMAIITFTNASGVATFTVARFANAYVKTFASTPFTKAKYILDKDIFTGDGADALGAQTSVVLSNAILYTASLTGLDAAAVTALGTVDDGMHTILK